MASSQVSQSTDKIFTLSHLLLLSFTLWQVVKYLNLQIRYLHYHISFPVNCNIFPELHVIKFIYYAALTFDTI